MKRYLILGASGALFTIVLSLIFSDLFQSWELKTLDTRFLLRGSLPTHPDIIMVDVDDASSDVYGQWPWKRTVHADMVHLLKEEGVKVVVYDILFKHPGVAEDDAQLAQSTADAQNVMFPVAVEFSDSDRATEDLPALPGGIAVPEGMDFPIVNRAIVPMPALTDKVKALGHIATNRDRDGIIRRVPLFLRYRDQLLPSMSFRAVLDFLDVDLKAIAFNGNTLTLPQAKPPGESQAMDISIPIDRKGQMLINFAGTWRDTFKHASFAAALKAGGKGQGEDLTGKLILVSNALSGLDFKTIPFEKNFPGGGVHANIINTLLTRNFLWETSGTMNILVVLLVSLLIAIVFRDRFFWTKLGAVLGLIAVYGMLTVMFFNQGIVMPLVIPSLSVVFTALLVSTYQVRIERKQKEMLIHEKQDLEGKLLEVSKNLDAKDRQMEAIRKSLEELGREMAEKNQQSEISSEKIYQLEGKLETLSR
ncbi:MAG: CHASE2 domain-containing protein, partial [Nitrospinaceae bacterium]|nr:CHASE2 domain-containing protein [Nitrospinaceae bacterium]NIR57766.1 CHASE2 domain-containing protein [Nitrospinaceae bacterium]NIS88228.1 CHASE2 domain-containing protein [Nitrospinaceae bacterium]NIT85108.1 CHASE2 domain-containing protein [Nitrospinaceae bacterium]NIU47265.1 CHASE2 domain-containing protein [Nitrospinaceae bacterium]